MDDWTQFLFTAFALAVVSAMIWGFYPIFAEPGSNGKTAAKDGAAEDSAEYEAGDDEDLIAYSRRVYGLGNASDAEVLRFLRRKWKDEAAGYEAKARTLRGKIEFLDSEIERLEGGRLRFGSPEWIEAYVSQYKCEKQRDIARQKLVRKFGLDTGAVTPSPA